MRPLKIIKYTVLLIIAACMVFPFVWIISTSFKGAGEIFAYPPKLIPENFVLENYTTLWDFLPFGIYFLNSIIVAAVTVFLNLLISSLAGYAFARFTFRGKGFLFLIVLASMMIPKELILIPLYSNIIYMGFSDTLAGVILPFAVEGFAIFLMRQAFLSIPREIEEAAIVDGAGFFRMWWKIMLPMTKPSLAVLAVFTFIGTWGDFLWPMIILKDQQNFTLQVGLSYMTGTFINNYRYIAAGSVMAFIPVFIVFLTAQKYFVRGIFAGSGK